MDRAFMIVGTNWTGDENARSYCHIPPGSASATGAACHPDSARAADTQTAAEFRSGEAYTIAKSPQQWCVRFHIHRMAFRVDHDDSRKHRLSSSKIRLVNVPELLQQNLGPLTKHET